MGEDAIRNILKNVGLTEKEAGVYIFLAKHGTLKGLEIARQIRIDKAEVYRILKSLQSKGLLESTLESPARFSTVPFDKVLDAFVKARRDEAVLVERAKEELLDDWKKISKTNVELAAEKFVVIEGDSKIYPKIFQMINATKQQLSAISTAPGLFRGYQSGLFDAAFQHPLKSNIQFRFLTELAQENLGAVKNLLQRIPNDGLNFRGRIPDLGLRLSPRMVIRDNEEILFFITPRTAPPEDDICLWTNCKALVQSFAEVFEDLWCNSTDIQKKIGEVETGKLFPHTYTSKNSVAKKYNEILWKAKEEIVIMTSSKALLELRSGFQLKDLAQRGISIKIMAPINGENLGTALQLLEFCEVKHIPRGYDFLTTVVDKTHVFQSNATFSDKSKLGTKYYENMFYTNDSEYVEKINNMLADIWRRARPPSAITLGSILNPVTNPPSTTDDPLSKIHDTLKKVDSVSLVEEKTPKLLTEKDVLNKIIDAKKDASKKNMQHGVAGQAILHLQGILNIPDLLFYVLHYDKSALFAPQNILLISTWSETPKGFAYIPAVFVCDNLKSLDFWKEFLAGLPFSQNMRLVKEDELQVKLYGNNLFCGWTVPIPLLPPSLTLQPACIMLEACGDLKTSSHTLDFPSGCRLVHEYNGFEAFVTFWNPSSKYSGPGTEGFIARENVSTTSRLSRR